MFKVLCVVDKYGTALDRLAQGVAKYHQNIEYKVLAIHPKRPDQQQIQDFLTELQTADIIDWQYFRTAEMLRSKIDISGKKHILTHNNPYSITESDWNNYDMVVANNESIQKDLKEITKARLEYVPLVADTDFWTFNNDWKKNDRVLMVANRIESKKGILQVAIACGDLGLKFVLVGNVSDVTYMNDIMSTGKVEFHENVSDEELRELYYSASVLVCNSVDGFESGTLPILEAMQCGTPVLTREIGHVPDIYNKKNLKILRSNPDDVPYIKDQLERMLYDEKALDEQRRAAWDSAKTRNFERRAYAYSKLYRSLQANGTPVTIITPIYDKPEITRQCLDAISKQTYKNIELIVCDDNPDGSNKQIIDEYKKFVNFPVRYLPVSSEGYGLAKARNMGIIEATGDIIVFCDQRIIMEPTAVEEFVKQIQPNTWLFGDKNGKTNFVENFSCVMRVDVVKAGMFNERINKYGGMSQEIRSRINKQGMQVRLIPAAKAIQAGKSRNKWTKQQEIIEMKNLLWKVGLE